MSKPEFVAAAAVLGLTAELVIAPWSKAPVFWMLTRGKRDVGSYVPATGSVHVVGGGLYVVSGDRAALELCAANLKQKGRAK